MYRVCKQYLIILWIILVALSYALASYLTCLLSYLVKPNGLVPRHLHHILTILSIYLNTI